MKWLKEQDLHRVFWDGGCNAAASDSSKEIFQWLVENGCPWNDQTGRCAVGWKGAEVLKFLKEKGYPHWAAEMCIEAASKWNFEALKCLREIGCPWNDLCYSAAVLWLKWRQQLLKDHNFPVENVFTLQSAYYARADIVMMLELKENGCPMTAETSAKVEATGRLEALKWLRENGCVWDSRTTAEAKKINDGEMLQWLSENGWPAV